MTMVAEIKVNVDQIAPSVLAEGNQNFPAMSKIGQLFTADWHTRLAMAGRVFRLNLGTTSGETTITGITGLAAHDNDRPEIVIAIDSGFLVPMEIDIAIQINDDNAYDDVTQVSVFADRSKTVPAGEAGTEVVPVNLLDGAAAFNGRCYTLITTEIANPVGSDVLAFKYWEVTQIGAEVGGSVQAEKSCYKKFEVPTFLAGPCSILGYVVGTNTPVFMGSITFAHIPTSWVPTS